MNMVISISVRITNFCRIDMRQPVVSGYFFRVFKNQSTNRISDIGVLINSPVDVLQIILHCLSNFNNNMSIMS